MTPEAINQAMAELDGWYKSEERKGYWKHKDKSMDGTAHGAPRAHNYTEDLNAVARVVPKLAALQVYRYKQALKRTRGGYYFKAIDATALQRCEAIIRAVGKWVDS